MEMADVATWISAAAAATLFGLTGFGDAVVVALTAVLTSADNGMGVCLALKDLSAVNVRRLLALCATGLCMVPVGLLALRKLDQASIQLVVGTGLLAFAVWRLSALVMALWTPPCLRAAHKSNNTCLRSAAGGCTRGLRCTPSSSGGRMSATHHPPPSPGGRSSEAGGGGGDTAIASVGRVALGMETPSIGPHAPDASPSHSWEALSARDTLGGGQGSDAGSAQCSENKSALSQDSDDPANSYSVSPPGVDLGGPASAPAGPLSLAAVPPPSPPHDESSTHTKTQSTSPRHRHAAGSAAAVDNIPSLQLPASATASDSAPAASSTARALDPTSEAWQQAPVEHDVMDERGHGHSSRPGWVCFSITACDRTIPICGLPVFSCQELAMEFKRLRWDADARWETWVLLLCGLVAGVAGGSIGINGPPIVVAFTVLKSRLSKDDMRSISVSYFFLELMAVRLPLLISSGLLSVAPGTAAGIVGAAVLGLSTGSAFRSYVDTDKIILVLVLLVFASAWLMTLSAVEGSTAATRSVQSVAIAISALLLTVLAGGWWAYTSARRSAAADAPHSAESVPGSRPSAEPKKTDSAGELSTVQGQIGGGMGHAPAHVPSHVGPSVALEALGPLDPPQSHRSTTV